MRFLMFLFFFFAALWFVGLVLRAAFSRWLSRRAAEFNQAAARAQKEAQRQARGRREGEVTVERAASGRTKRVNKNVGEYVDFEDIKS